MIYQNWHLFIPPLLTLLDDGLTSVRVSGLEITQALLRKTPAKVLKQTGLGEVFEDAIIPTLSYLPSLTPVNESVKLLVPAYEALYLLGDVLFPDKEERPAKIKLMDRIMRQGILQGIEHCSDNVRIVEVLLVELSKLLPLLGIYAVKHLKVSVHLQTILISAERRSGNYPHSIYNTF